MAGLEISGDGKPFVAKEGTTYEEVQKYGTEMQKKAFIFLDSDTNDKLEGREVFDFNNSKYSLYGDTLTINYPNVEINENDLYRPAGYEEKHANVNETQKLRNIIRQNNLNLGLYLDLDNIKSFKLINDSGKQKLFLDSCEFSITIPIQKNSERMYICECDGEPDFINLPEGTVVTVKDVSTAYHPGFYNCNCQVDFQGRKEYGTNLCYWHSTLSINSKKPKNKLNGENLPVGTTIVENKTPEEWEEYKRQVKEKYNVEVK